jgi:hypothetical protein
MQGPTAAALPKPGELQQDDFRTHSHQPGQTLRLLQVLSVCKRACFSGCMTRSDSTRLPEAHLLCWPSGSLLN